ncbi:glycosyltransferase family protein [Portibacter lacus]|uniref:Glycosyl transferase n=1 Tax=Portibacter lacus TaxID=1099794 RepID=A0AA37SRD9_9BACT|nr:glycosyltransferase family protein [Portibacter lacus]GLR18129.1 glycosyl transferase [Portibacter lacus]
MTNNILYCVLNWGLGHASRSVPIIQGLLDQGHHLSIASDGVALDLLRKEFPSLRSFELTSYDIVYKYESIVVNILSQCHKLFNAVAGEKQEIARLVEEYGFDQIISDNRFGCYHDQCKSVIITHQIRLLHMNSFIQASGTRMNMYLLNKFDECWVPDFENEKGLSGRMSHEIDLKIPIKFIGTQSRFSSIPLPTHPKFETISILSGPEPQRSKFEDALVKNLQRLSGKHLIVTGKQIDDYSDGNIFFVGLREVKELASLIAESKVIISRSGYSSLMDFEAMGRKSILVPTPGQTEQEYLAKWIAPTSKHIVLSQDNLDLRHVIH